MRLCKKAFCIFLLLMVSQFSMANMLIDQKASFTFYSFDNIYSLRPKEGVWRIVLRTLQMAPSRVAANIL
jgi:hypothetical protein